MDVKNTSKQVRLLGGTQKYKLQISRRHQCKADEANQQLALNRMTQQARNSFQKIARERLTTKEIKEKVLKPEVINCRSNRHKASKRKNWDSSVSHIQLKYSNFHAEIERQTLLLGHFAS